MDNQDIIEMVKVAAASCRDLTVQTYSGRGMHGKYCLSVSGRRSDMWALFARMGDVSLAEQTCEDSMGRDIVLYWPSIAYEGEPSDEAEDS